MLFARLELATQEQMASREAALRGIVGSDQCIRQWIRAIIFPGAYGPREMLVGMTCKMSNTPPRPSLRVRWRVRLED